MPVEPQSILPGWRRAASMQASKLLKGESLRTVKPKVWPDSPMMKLKSRRACQATFCIDGTRSMPMGYRAMV